VEQIITIIKCANVKLILEVSTMTILPVLFTSLWISLSMFVRLEIRVTWVSAVCPGLGHASENPELPNVMNEKEIIFLGPPSVVISALGHKTGSSLMSKQQ
jgi:hypothetical protein